MRLPVLIERILDLLLPPTCHVCGHTLMPDERFLCRTCLISLPRTHYHGRDANPVEMRLAGLLKFDCATSHFFYAPDSPLASLIHDFKYRNFPAVARRLGAVVGEELYLCGWLTGVDVICPVPLHWRKEMRRGYNQSRELALGISEASGIEVSSDLRAIRGHVTQTSLSHEERRRNTQGIFRLRHPERYAGRCILLLDDVCTTGATLFAAGEAILAAQPGARLRLLTLAATF
ncbi:MAG: ComF family protein [Muribaculaceae bacterium]|nr:ComF family protein [Muribaculaceae bacterium]